MREEFAKFEQNVSVVRAAFENALSKSDYGLFLHSPELIDVMVNVGAFDFEPGEIEECVEFTWHVNAVEMLFAVCEWLRVVDMPNGALAKLKKDVMRVYRRVWSDDPYDDMFESVDSLNKGEFGDEVYRSRDIFRRLVSIARGLAPAVKEETKKADKKSAGKYHDAELNQNAKKYVFNLSPADRSFKCAMIKNRVSLSTKQFEVAKIILCGACDAEGWVSFPSGVRIPSKLKGCADAFFSYVRNDGGGRYRLMGTKQERTKGGKRSGSGAPLKQYASATA